MTMNEIFSIIRDWAVGKFQPKGEYARADHVHPAQTTVSGNAGTATKFAVARTIDGVSFDGSAAIAHYGTCSTAAATATKIVACTGFTLATGAVIRVKFTITNTATSPTLNVNNTGAKPIYYRGAAISAGYLAAKKTYEFVYNGTQYDLIGDINTNTTYSNMTAATDDTAGKSGLVPAPAAGTHTKYLTGAGTFENVDDHAITFTSGDNEDPSVWADIAPMTTGEKLSSFARKCSLGIKNLRYLKSLIGTTDLSGLGDGTITGAISSLNSNLKNATAGITFRYYTGNTTLTNLLNSLSAPCICMTNTESITDKPSGKYGVIMVFKQSDNRTGAICLCTDGAIMHNTWNSSTAALNGWK